MSIRRNKKANSKMGISRNQDRILKKSSNNFSEKKSLGLLRKKSSLNKLVKNKRKDKVPFVEKKENKVIEKNVSGYRPLSGERSPSCVSLPFMMLICLCVLICASGFIYHLQIRFEGVRLGYETSEQRTIQTDLMLRRRELSLELSTIKVPSRIEDEARDKLEMEVPEFSRIVSVNKKRRVVSVSGGAL